MIRCLLGGDENLKKKEIEICIMPENPYYPACRHGYIEYPDPEDTSVTIWHCLLEKSEGDERKT